MKLTSAANTLIPAYLALLAKGYAVTCERSKDGAESWIAHGALGRFQAEDTLSLLGLVTIAETRGDAWRASDEEIEAFLEKFGGSNLKP